MLPRHLSSPQLNGAERGRCLVPPELQRLLVSTIPMSKNPVSCHRGGPTRHPPLKWSRFAFSTRYGTAQPISFKESSASFFVAITFPCIFRREAHDCPGEPEGRPLALGRLREEPVDEGPAPQDPRIRHGRGPAPTEGAHRGPTARTPQQASPLQLPAPPLGAPRCHEGPVGVLGPPEPEAELGEDGPGVLPGDTDPRSGDPR